MKYIVETISSHKLVHVVEAESVEEAYRIAENADDNYQEHIGIMHYDVSPCTDERIEYYRSKNYFWDGVTYINEHGYVAYRHPNGEERELGGPKLK